MYEGVNMKKLLILTLAMILIVGASVQARDTLFVNIGTADLSDLAVGVDKWFDLPLFMTAHTTDLQGADINAPLGINNCYVDLFGSDTECFALFPLANWDVATFGNFNEDYMTDGNGCTWDSYTFTGFQDPSPPYTSPALEFTPFVWIQTLSFRIHTINRPELLDSTICDAVGAGMDPVSGPWNCGDPLGGAGYECVVEAACFWFSPNQPPVIEEFTTGDVCTYEDFSIPFDVTDPDSDPLDVTSTAGTVVLVGSDVDGDATIYHYLLDFDMEDFCGTCFNGEVVITATDNNNDPVTWNAGSVAIIGVLTASMDPALYIWPGESEWMPVYLDVCADCFCLGGFVFSIEYDASILTVTDVVRGAALMGGEYWNVNYNVDGPGTIRVTFINDLNNQTPVEEICGFLQEPLFLMEFALEGDITYPTNFCVDICFMFDGVGEDHYDYNNVSDAGGYHVWMNDGCDDAPDSTQYGTLLLEMECGNIKVLDEHNVNRGDINLNGFPYDVGDVVLLANHLIDPAAFPFTLRQMIASDVNLDGFRATIADLIYMINVVNGIITPGGKVAPLDAVATVAMPVDAYGDVDVTIASDLSVGGALVSINHTGVELGVPIVSGMNIDYRDNGDVMTVLVYNEDAVSFAPGANVLFTVPVLTEGAISFGDVSVSDNRGALLDARTALDAPLPAEFSVSQNFPNPFNAKTSLSFALPTPAITNINIYNVAGQLVESMDLGQMNAGHHSVIWDASDVASGIYFYKVSAGDNNETMKMTLLK
jgi:hypothetical protein